MKRIVLVFGSIAGIIVVSMFIITMPLYKNGVLNFGNGAIIGYSTMFIAMSMVFFGVKSYRDNHSRGIITFGEGFKVGLLIAAVATLMYAVGWEFYLNLFAPNWIDDYSALSIAHAKSEGADAARMEKVVTYLNSVKEIYQNPIYRFLMTMMEILPVGLLFALASAAILRKREVLPA